MTQRESPSARAFAQLILRRAGLAPTGAPPPVKVRVPRKPVVVWGDNTRYDPDFFDEREKDFRGITYAEVRATADTAGYDETYESYIFRPVCYIAGPMTGKKDWNFPAFDAAADYLDSKGFEVRNPAQSFGRRTDLDYDQYIGTALRQITNGGLRGRAVDFLVVLPGWDKSNGARLEVALAQTLGIPVYTYSLLRRMGLNQYSRLWGKVSLEYKIKMEPGDLPEYHPLVVRRRRELAAAADEKKEQPMVSNSRNYDGPFKLEVPSEDPSIKTEDLCTVCGSPTCGMSARNRDARLRREAVERLSIKPEDLCTACGRTECRESRMNRDNRLRLEDEANGLAVLPEDMCACGNPDCFVSKERRDARLELARQEKERQAAEQEQEAFAGPTLTQAEVEANARRSIFNAVAAGLWVNAEVDGNGRLVSEDELHLHASGPCRDTDDGCPSGPEHNTIGTIHQHDGTHYGSFWQRGDILVRPKPEEEWIIPEKPPVDSLSSGQIGRGVEHVHNTLPLTANGSQIRHNTGDAEIGVPHSHDMVHHDVPKPGEDIRVRNPKYKPAETLKIMGGEVTIQPWQSALDPREVFKGIFDRIMANRVEGRVGGIESQNPGPVTTGEVAENLQQEAKQEARAKAAAGANLYGIPGQDGCAKSDELGAFERVAPWVVHEHRSDPKFNVPNVFHEHQRAHEKDDPYTRGIVSIGCEDPTRENVESAEAMDDIKAALENAPSVSRETETIQEEAERLVHGDRQAAYGAPSEDFARTGKLWAAILDLDEPIDPVIVALMMAALKLSREVHAPKRDNRVDAVGYLLCAQDILEERGTA